MLNGKVNDGRCLDLHNNIDVSNDVQGRPKYVKQKKDQTLKDSK